MKTRVTLRFLDEVRRFDLRFFCEECAHFNGDRCAHGYPRGERRRELREGELIELCKEHEA